MKKTYFKSILAASLVVFSLSSCLKDDRTELDPAKGVNVIEFDNPAQVNIIGTSTPAYTIAYPIVTTDQSVPVTISYSGPEAGAPQDITVSFSLVNQSLLDTYNTENKTTYTMMDPAVYRLDATSVTIPKGQSKATFNVIIKTSLFDLTKSYALPLRINTVSSGTISGNFGTIILNLAGKNAYDGIYKPVDGQFQRYSSPTSPTTNDALNGFMGFNANMTLSTVNATTVLVAGLRWGSSVPNTGNSSGVAGIDNLQFIVDPATNLVTCRSLGNATLRNIVGAVNKYDPATKEFTVSFDWNQTSTKREVKGLVLRYVGVR